MSPARIPSRYSAVAIALHWLIAIVMIPMLFLGEELMEAEGSYVWLPSLHMSLGMAVLVLSVLRLIWRLVNPPPPFPYLMKPWEIKLSRAVHALFYLLMIGLPLSGWLALTDFLVEHPPFAGTSAFGITLPALPDLGIPAEGIHEIGGKIGIVLLGLHVLAVLKHQFWDRDGVLTRILPGTRSS